MIGDDHYDLRWLCWQCGDLDYLNAHGLCRTCKPERVKDWVAVCSEAAHGVRREVGRRWRIG